MRLELRVECKRSSLFRYERSCRGRREEELEWNGMQECGIGMQVRVWVLPCSVVYGVVGNWSPRPSSGFRVVWILRMAGEH